MRRFIFCLSTFVTITLAQVMPIRWAIEDANGDGKPDRRGQTVTVTGIVTAPDSIFDNRYTDIYIQDTSGGVNVFSFTMQNADLKDSVLVTGKVDWYRGKTEIANATITLLARNRTLPEPRILTCREMNAEAYEGELVAITGVKISSLFLVGNTNYNLEDSTGTTQVRIDAQTEIPGFILSPDTFTIIGIKGQYTSDTTQPLTGYQLLPRYRRDFSSSAEDYPLITIRAAQQPGPDGVTPQLLDQWVRVKGKITGPARVFTTGSGKSLYIQDVTQGVNVYNCSYPDGQAPFLDSLGIEITALGRITEYNGLTELSSGVMWVSDTSAVPVTPKLLPFNTPLTETMESDLLTVVGDVISAPVRSGSGYNMVLKNGTPAISVRIYDNTGIQTSWLTAGRRVRITGIVGQYDYEPPYNTGYQLMPRFPEDISDTTAAFPPSERLQIDSIFPNPFAPNEGEIATIQINSPRTGYRLTVAVYDLLGRLRRQLLTSAPGGYYDLKWDGTDDRLQRLPAGIYLLNIKASRGDGSTETINRPIVLAVKLN
ncbi:MAG: FlgD immunoglobulin-like domain containing protein [candidate division WOR-3 bacterium]|nr:T9SS type A sorting domain-containing protein [candidate division WOR-3 bacterium]MDH7518940.1 FlgD immunoglobulin-like domain containing protein [bacterium]